MKSVSALYENFDAAQKTIRDLVDAGFPRENISLVINDRTEVYKANLDRREDVTGSEGAGFGAVVGALVGLGAMMIPGIGPVIAAGPLVAGLVSRFSKEMRKRSIVRECQNKSTIP